MIIISETILNELLTRKNRLSADSSVSKVYYGNNWVKKIKNPATNTGSTYSKEELLQYTIMQDNQNSGIFPPTIVKQTKDKNGALHPLILQRKVDVDSQISIYHKIIINIQPINFRQTIEVIGDRGISSSMKEDIREIHETLSEGLSKYFDEYIDIVSKLHQIRKKYHLEYRSDLNSGNFGFYNGKLVIIDFLSPYLKI